MVGPLPDTRMSRRATNRWSVQTGVGGKSCACEKGSNGLLTSYIDYLLYFWCIALHTSFKSVPPLSLSCSFYVKIRKWGACRVSPRWCRPRKCGEGSNTQGWSPSSPSLRGTSGGRSQHVEVTVETCQNAQLGGIWHIHSVGLPLPVSDRTASPQDGTVLTGGHPLATTKPLSVWIGTCHVTGITP